MSEYGVCFPPGPVLRFRPYIITFYSSCLLITHNHGYCHIFLKARLQWNCPTQYVALHIRPLPVSWPMYNYQTSIPWNGFLLHSLIKWVEFQLWTVGLHIALCPIPVMPGIKLRSDRYWFLTQHKQYLISSQRTTTHHTSHTVDIMLRSPYPTVRKESLYLFNEATGAHWF